MPNAAEAQDLPAIEARAWLCDHALPLWIERGVDRQYGGFEEALSLSGERLHGLTKRIRVQARQIYVMSHAALLGWSAQALSTAQYGFDFLTKFGWHAQGGWVHHLAPDGAIRDSKRDTYDHAFILMALSWFYRASGDGRALDWIERTLAFMDKALGEEDGSFRESVPAALPRRQNPHMHFFEAMLALYDATGERDFLERARRIYGLLDRHFFDANHGVLREYFSEGWSIVPGGEGAIIEPGHHCEWVWLLDRFERLSAEPTGVLRRGLVQFALKHGRDPRTGFFVDEVAPDGMVLKSSMRCWPQTEGLKAMLVLFERGEPWAKAEAVALARGLLDRYLAVSPRGLWQDQFDRTGGALATNVPASTLYHVFLAFTELVRLQEGQPSLNS